MRRRISIPNTYRAVTDCASSRACLESMGRRDLAKRHGSIGRGVAGRLACAEYGIRRGVRANRALHSGMERERIRKQYARRRTRRMPDRVSK